MKLFVLALCVAFAASAPVDTANDAAANKVNSTDAASASPRAYGGYPYSYAAAPYNSYYGQQLSSPMMYPAHQSAAAPQYSYSGYSPAATSMPYSYGSNAYYTRNQNTLPSNAKTSLALLRGYPSSMYAQPQVYVPVSSSHSHGYQPSSLSSYPYSYGYGGYSGYDSYTPSYHRSADESEVTPSAHASLEPAVNYRTKYILEQPEYVKDQPQIIEFERHPVQRPIRGTPSDQFLPQLVEFQRHPAQRALPGEPSDEILAVNVIPTPAGYSPLSGLRALDVAVDDKMQMKFSPQYAMNRFHAQAAPAMFSRTAADESPMNAFPTNVDSEDQVFMEFNQYSAPQSDAAAHALPQAPRAAEEQLYYPQSGISPNWINNFGLPMAAGSIQGSAFSPENMQMRMLNYYTAINQEHLDAERNRLYQNQMMGPTKKSSSDALPGLDAKIRALEEDRMNNDIPKNPANEKKDMKEEKSTEKSA